MCETKALKTTKYNDNIQNVKGSTKYTTKRECVTIHKKLQLPNLQNNSKV